MQNVLLGGSLLSIGFVSWLYGKVNYGYISDILSSTPGLEQNSPSGYYYLEGPVHSENPIEYTAPSNNVDIVPSYEDDNNKYIRLDETVFCVLDNSETRVERSEYEICLGYISNKRTTFIKNIKDVKKSHTTTKIAYPITINNVNIDEFVESIPLTFINRTFVSQKEMGSESTNTGVRLSHLATVDIQQKPMIGFEFERQGVPITSKITVFGWYDATNRRMKRKRGTGIVHIIDNKTEEDHCHQIDVETKPILISKTSKTDIENYYTSLNRKWNLIGYGCVLLGGVLIGLPYVKK